MCRQLCIPLQRARADERAFAVMRVEQALRELARCPLQHRLANDR